MGRSRRVVLAPACLAAVASAVAFLVVRPPVGDLWAARARESAAHAGVGLHYWFSWFAGLVPGHYSVLVPYLAHVVHVEVLGAVATALITPLTYLAVRATPHPVAAVWVATVTAGVNLWSGRVPFAQGAAFALIALILVLRGRVLAAPVGVVAALVSPVSAVFLGLALVGVARHDPRRLKVAVATGVASGGTVLALGLYFGAPGPEGFTAVQAAGAVLACLILLTTRPYPAVRTVLWISLVVTVAVAVVPNGLGSNFERFTWLCLPVAAVASARVPLGRAVAVVAVAVGFAGIGSAKDLWVATQPPSTPSYYAGVIRELDRTPALSNVRLEVVPDGTHVAATVLLDHAMLARGYETQTDTALNPVLLADRLDAGTYRRWLDRFAVGYVLLDRNTLFVTPEDTLVRHRTPAYLHRVWTDGNLELYAVRNPTPVVDAPAHIVDADQANLVITTPRACVVRLRVHWSRFLVADGAELHPTADGWVRLTLPSAGTYTVHA